MAQARGGKPFAVVVDGHGTEHDFIAAVHVNVLNGKIVVALAKPGATSYVVAPVPTPGQFVGGRIHVVSGKFVAGVSTTTEENGGLLSVQIWCAEVVLGCTVTAIAVFSPHGQ
ncbi:MAG: hypothetical protein BWY72_00985 [Bacteroidetes bacterium ADurb.Bin416]|nr:MAG: hypothetical protein BWY72_00985 [Bacteroidetes bacterium ADurb.Bin416]